MVFLHQKAYSPMRLPVALLALVLLSSCGPGRDGSSLRWRFAPISARHSGIYFQNNIRESESFNVLQYGYLYNGGGVAIGDIDNDGLADIYFSSNMGTNRLYRNLGDLRFEDITEAAGVGAGDAWNTGVTMADVNQDGYLDIYVCRSADAYAEKRRNLLFMNRGDGTFAEEAQACGLADEAYSTQAAFFDYDRDGDLDLYLLNHSVQQYAGFNQYLSSYKQERSPIYGDKLYRNEEGFFKDVTEEAGIMANVLGFGLGLSIADFDGDQWPDIYVGNDYHEQDYYYRNNADGTFTECLGALFGHVSLFSMGNDAGDINNDGKPDLLTLDMLPSDAYRQGMTSGPDNYDKYQLLVKGGFHHQTMRNMLQLNQGKAGFSEIGLFSRVAQTDWSWSALLADYNNDGWQDLFVTNGYKRDYTNMDFLLYATETQTKIRNGAGKPDVSAILKKMPPIRIPDELFENNGDLTFSSRLGSWLKPVASMAHGAAYADLDNDGDLELVASQVDGKAIILRNNTREQDGGNFISLSLSGPKSQAEAIGASVCLYAGGLRQMREIYPVRGFQSTCDARLHLGLGSKTRIDSILISWPDGSLQVLQGVQANQFLKVSRKNNSYSPAQVPPPALFEKVMAEDSLLIWEHEEDLPRDFKQQVLLPRLYSCQGPGLALGDADGDGREDIYVCGAAGQGGTLFFQGPGGGYLRSNRIDFAAAREAEEVDARFFDGDGDGDMDLYVVTGQYGQAVQSPLLRDIYYENKGAGRFFPLPDALPDIRTCGARVLVLDANRDGRPDLFIPGRINPEAYPEIPAHTLLMNKGKGIFSDSSSWLGTRLLQSGMLSDALFLDLDRDGEEELITLGEWMPLQIWRRQGRQWMPGKVLAPSGMWNMLYAFDANGDGHPDLLAGNLGRNSRWQVPLTLYYGDFDGNGTRDPIMAHTFGQTPYPLASRDDLLAQMPSFKKRFITYDAYARCSLDALLSKQVRRGAREFVAERLSSAFLLNDGRGNFREIALPGEAQFAPLYAAAAGDWNGDGHIDLLLGGNDSRQRVYMGKLDASRGQVLVGDGKGSFRCLTQDSSGLDVRGDVRRLVRLQNGQFLFMRNDDSPVTYRLNR